MNSRTILVALVGGVIVLFTRNGLDHQQPEPKKTNSRARTSQLCRMRLPLSIRQSPNSGSPALIARLLTPQEIYKTESPRNIPSHRNTTMKDASVSWAAALLSLQTVPRSQTITSSGAPPVPP